MKQGIEFFPLDTQPDDPMELIEAEFGMLGFGIVVRLLQYVYGREGYYLPWTEERRMLFSHKMGEKRDTVEQVVEACLRWGIFDRGLYEREQVLTSREIQEQFLRITARRRNREMRAELVLVELPSDCAPVADNSVKSAASGGTTAPIPGQRKEPERRETVTQDAPAEGHSPAAETAVQAAPVTPGFVPPSPREIMQYCRERGSSVDPILFFHHYKTNGWREGNAPMTDWKAVLRAWEQNGSEQPRRPVTQAPPKWKTMSREEYFQSLEQEMPPASLPA